MLLKNLYEVFKEKKIKCPCCGSENIDKIDNLEIYHYRCNDCKTTF